jgi:hypothetical protein
MEIGSFIELDIKNTGEYYNTDDCIRLNAARGGIYHSCKLYGVSKLYLPYYVCPSVVEFLSKHDIQLFFYSINELFTPQLTTNDEDSAVLVVNYFGIFSKDFITKISENYVHVIIDNSQAFYSLPIENCINVYSPRKFFGVPDGCYVLSLFSDKSYLEYSQDLSSHTAGFLFKRIEIGCSAAYAERMLNEERIEQSDVLRMSVLTQSILSGIDYETIRVKRLNNFNIAHTLFESINLINPTQFFNSDCVPMVYPLVIRKADLVDQLAKQHIYTGRWWKHVLRRVESDSFEAFMSEYMIPVPIDQRYGVCELRIIAETIQNLTV